MSDCQRWRKGRESYRPRGEPIDTTKYGVEKIDRDTAKEFVVAHHYEHSFPAQRSCHGLFRAGAGLVGVAVFSQPMNVATLPKYLNPAVGAELGRLVLLDDVPANGESWFLGRCFRALRTRPDDFGGIVSFSDPVQRTSEAGHVVKPGHFGTIYQAFNGRYVGRGKPGTLILDPAGRVVSARGLAKLRNGERGDAAVYARLIAAGAPKRRAGEKATAYVKRALATGPFRRLKHPGNFAYVWSLRDDIEIKLAPKPYPKADSA